ncbi:vascular-related unknown protein 2-like [Brassica napus]|uniref:vascular-related unknown protein 2-like n=1 Tax=Brassica napus TaxID=3708 RepID=UPI0020786892|nr:vascular-related unknown protein 2-like [Brassica napus]
MENSVNNCVRQKVFSNHQVRTIHEEEEDQKEESSWLIYFEDIDHEDEMVEEMSHYYDNDSSMISDAASPVHNTKIHNVARRKANSINTNPKKRSIIHQHKEEKQEEEGDEDEEEDTASSPSNKTKVRLYIYIRVYLNLWSWSFRFVKFLTFLVFIQGCHVLDGGENNVNVTSEVIFKKHCVARDIRSNINEVINEEFLSAELKKRGLCLVPLSTFSNFIA